jgi:hypothetical protein
MQRWRKVYMKRFNFGTGIFDGTAASRRRLRELGLATLGDLRHRQRTAGAGACDAMAVTADLTVGPDGTVSGLNVPTHIDPAGLRI